MKELFNLNEDVAVVIGGTGELGGTMAEALGAAGAKVAVVGRNAERGNARAGRIADNGGTAKFFAADGLNADSLDEARQEIAKWSGKPASILVNAAGGNRPDATIPPGGDYCKLPLDAWRDDPNVELVILDAQGEKAFCAGGDIAELYERGTAGDFA
ncbi:MAG: SDR family NAD(P)-dependent oxidoreductase, partial [Rubripirellula sp.]